MTARTEGSDPEGIPSGAGPRVGIDVGRPVDGLVEVSRWRGPGRWLGAITSLAAVGIREGTP